MRYKLTLGALKSVALLPLWVLYRISDLAAVVLQYVVKYRRKLVEENLRRVFPEASDTMIKQWRKRFYRHLCDTFVETVKLLGMSDREADRRIEVIGASLVDEAVESGHSAVLFLGHYGNWEWVTAITRHFRSSAAMTQIYHPLSSPTMDALMLRIRSRFGSESIAMKRTLRRLMEIERGGNQWICGFIADQRPAASHHNEWTEFLGIDTTMIVGAEVIGQRLDACYFYIDVQPKSRGYYRLTFRRVEPDDDLRRPDVAYPYSRQYLRMLEATIRRDPSYWLWSHNRFAHRRN